MKRSKNTLLSAAVACGAALLAVLPAQAAHTVFLSAESFTKTLPDGKQVLMWGYKAHADATFSSVGDATSPGPAIVVPAAETQLQIVLKNNLTVSNSIVIPGQNGFVRLAGKIHGAFTDGEGRERARSLVNEVGPGQQVTYVWNNVTPGTYLYHSGSHPQLQVQMGLFGALTRNAPDDPATTGIEVYPGKTVDSEITVLLSEIDSRLHEAVRTNGYGPGLAVSSTMHSLPDYFLINGDAYPQATTPLAVGVGQTVLVRLLNAGYNERVPTFNGQHLAFIAEDGRLYPGARQQYAPLLPALKTTDALWTAPTAAGEVVVYDRRLGLSNGLTPDGGMIKKVAVN